MVASFAAVYLLYNHITTANIRSKAEFALSYMLDAIDDSEYSSDPTAYGASIISTDISYERDDFDPLLKNAANSYSEDDYYGGDYNQDIDYDKLYPAETVILDWYKENSAFDGMTYCIKESGFTIYTAQERVLGGYFIYYVDVTSEMSLLKSFTLVFWIVMAVCLVGAGLLGVLFGRHIEHDQ